MNVFDTLAHSARQWPDRTAIIDAGGALDYQSLWREVEALRVQLDRLGVREGQGVGVRARNGRAFVIGARALGAFGRLVLTDPAQPLSSGIEVEARPGRRAREAPLPALRRRTVAHGAGVPRRDLPARPSPFYLLDEVEPRSTT